MCCRTDKNLFKLCGLALLILIVPFVVFGVAHFVVKLNGIASLPLPSPLTSTLPSPLSFLTLVAGIISGILAIVTVIVFVIFGVRIAIMDSRVSTAKYVFFFLLLF